MQKKNILESKAFNNIIFKIFILLKVSIINNNSYCRRNISTFKEIKEILFILFEFIKIRKYRKIKLNSIGF